MGLVWATKTVYLWNKQQRVLNIEIRNAFRKWNYHKASRHTHNAIAELEEISPYDSQTCLLRKQNSFDIITSA